MRALGLDVAQREPGGLSLNGTRRDLYALNLHLRSASRVLVRLARFRATSFAELERRARRVPWGEVLAAGVRPVFNVTCRKSRLYHSDAVAERLTRAAANVGGAPAGDAAPAVNDAARAADDAARAAGDAARATGGAERAAVDAEHAVSDTPHEQRFIVRLVRDKLTLSADASGEHLHRRGYREATARAPLRETLAAAALLSCGWQPDQALVDPLCGSGTFAIEGALLARRIPSGWRRAFAFERWPDFDADAWAALRTEAEARMLPRAPAPIVASDRDAGAVAFATANAERAGVEADIVFGRAALSEAHVPAGWTGAGWMVTNPPWGRRVGERGPLRDLYARLGQIARERFLGWGLAVLTAAPELAAQVEPGLHRLLATRSGNVPVTLWTRGG